MYHSKKCRYVQLYVDSDKADQVMEDSKERTLCQKGLALPSQRFRYRFCGEFTTIGDPICGHRSLEKTQSFDGLRFLLTIVR